MPIHQGGRYCLNDQGVRVLVECTYDPLHPDRLPKVSTPVSESVPASVSVAESSDHHEE
jgi:hypothetical protein